MLQLSATIQALRAVRPRKIVALVWGDEPLIKIPPNLRPDSQFVFSAHVGWLNRVIELYVSPAESIDYLVLWLRKVAKRPEDIDHKDDLDLETGGVHRDRVIAYCSNGDSPLECAAFWMAALSYADKETPNVLRDAVFLKGGLLTAEEFDLLPYFMRDSMARTSASPSTSIFATRAAGGPVAVRRPTTLASEQAVRSYVEQAILKEHRTLTAYAALEGVTVQYDSNVLAGRKPIPAWMLKRFGIRHVVEEHWVIPD